MDPLQLQLLLRQLQEKAKIGPSPIGKSFPYPNELGILNTTVPPQEPTIGPAKPTLSSIMMSGQYPMEMNAGMPPKRGPSIGPAQSRFGLTSGMAVPNELGMDIGGEQGINPAVDLPPVASPQAQTAEPLQPIPADYATDIQSTMKIRTPEATAGGKELPYQTFERLTGQKWTGGRSKFVQDILSRLGITAVPGSPEANLALQKALIGNAEGIIG